jgi:hypothetical protein
MLTSRQGHENRSHYKAGLWHCQKKKRCHFNVVFPAAPDGLIQSRGVIGNFLTRGWEDFAAVN